MTRYRNQVLRLSATFDPTDPDLRPFAAKGKLLLIDYGADYLKSPYGSRDYYLSVRRRLGAGATDRFFRYYMIPGLSHTARGNDLAGRQLPNKVDVVSLLENWVERGETPGVERLQSYDEAGRVIAERPMCPYPQVAMYYAVRGFSCSTE